MKTRLAGTARALFAAILLLFAARSCVYSQSVIARNHRRARPKLRRATSEAYVVLVSFDGYRYDYPKLYGATHLEAMAAHGASAPDGMIPSYPSITFPNHFTIVTGLYPEHHGIVANEFYDPQRKQHYASSDQKRISTEVGTAASRSGRSRKSRACAPPAFSGPAPKRKSPASGPPTICISTIVSRTKSESIR